MFQRLFLAVVVALLAGCEIPPGHDASSAAGANDAKAVHSTTQAPVLPSGGNPVRIVNPNDFSVAVELRSNGASKTFSVRPNADAQVLVADGRFDIFFEYSNEPGARFAGDPFSLDHQGIEIQIVKAANGNYGLHRVQ